MNFTETEERQALRKAVAELAAKYGHEYYLEKARARRATPSELWDEAGKLGYLGVNLPEEYGGGGAGIDELSRGVRGARRRGLRPADDGGLTRRSAARSSPRFGTEEQKQRWLPGLADGSDARWRSPSPSPTPDRTRTASPPPPAATAATGC